MATYTYAILNDPLAVGPSGTIAVGINDGGCRSKSVALVPDASVV
jgi:hypothetical protein